MARVPCSSRIAWNRSTYSRSRSGATAVSSTYEIALVSPTSASESPSAAWRSFQTRACAASSVIRWTIVARPRTSRSACKRSSRGNSSAADSPMNSTIRIAPGSPTRKSPSGSNAGLPRVMPSNWRSISSTADGPCSRMNGVAAIASPRVRNSATPRILAFGGAVSASVASSTRPSVPSEPTISLHRSKASSGRTKRSRL